ncbi:PREDICTED: PAXIP1-associated glutamate-rich protein 1-like [Priapulus caudatus]|uniref:PAXIP1-associated glutamate-rich protein 1-like n=1 Tax=Priapulus caudatus TaxID=37621 RepID=A0ABM1F9L3_PRICU|nr:PREDICTED: PAXIP1-associated glutamate-rich protein 1-like [Priapulus caudatus]XP_014681133.1 PREDICTED: PAXIP1-associated glutamate-rich protein 1-like [Priapulus caudatus]XP_014681134.1 PREDICTED: PAXIP1-associated glutamate-rich protein 1-like [Priapulus caudatus]
MQGQDDDWFAACSDDEIYKPDGSLGDDWHPDPKEIYQLYKRIESNPVLQLQWKNPGRRPPTPDTGTDDHLPIGTDDSEEKIEESTEFDFDEDFGFETSVSITPRRTPRSARLSHGAPKRVASLNQVMKDMARHKRLEQELLHAEQTAKTTAELAAHRAGLHSLAGGTDGDASSHRQAERSSPKGAGGAERPSLSPRGSGAHSPRQLSLNPRGTAAQSFMGSASSSPRQAAGSHSPGSGSPRQAGGALTPRQYPAHSPRQVSS